MVTDESEDNAETWAFLDRRLEEAERLEATLRPGNVNNVISAATTVAASLASAGQSLVAGAAANPQQMQAGIQNLLNAVTVQAQLLAQQQAQAPAAAAPPQAPAAAAPAQQPKAPAAPEAPTVASASG
mmetsp:Transcript_28509/g.91364  ORF Transcript_28509/g.91364 Transcript_28509/m.91364 type:complete len:128 (-) Transcript_28509:1778-2161(-)